MPLLFDGVNCDNNFFKIYFTPQVTKMLSETEEKSKENVMLIDKLQGELHFKVSRVVNIFIVCYPCCGFDLLESSSTIPTIDNFIQKTGIIHMHRSYHTSNIFELSIVPKKSVISHLHSSLSIV